MYWLIKVSPSKILVWFYKFLPYLNTVTSGYNCKINEVVLIIFLK